MCVCVCVKIFIEVKCLFLFLLLKLSYSLIITSLKTYVKLLKFKLLNIRTKILYLHKISMRLKKKTEEAMT